MWAIQIAIDGLDQTGWNGMGPSNLERWSTSEIECSRMPWPPAWGSSSSSYGAQNEARFLPTRSRSQVGVILRTYGGRNVPLEASNNSAAWLVFNDICGGAPASRVVLAVAAVVGLLPPSGGLAQESSTRRRLARQWWLGLGSNSLGIRHYL
jgi:hypothetical protein